MALDLVTRTRDVVANVENPVFIDELEALLPDTLPVRRFVEIAKAAIRTNPDLVTSDQTSLFGALIRCAQDGLEPNGVEAALVPYKGKVSYLPMVAGLRKVAAEYGWTIKTAVVYANDDFDYMEEPAEIRHKPVRPGDAKGDRIAAYAIATHRDGRRIQKVMDADAVAKVRAKAQTQAVWNEWTDQMWMKSPAKAVVKLLPLAERDRIDRVSASEFTPDGASAAEALYGPETPAAITASPQDDGGTSQQAAAPAPPHGAAAPGDDDIEDGVFEPVDEPAAAGATAEEFAAAAKTTVNRGSWAGKTFAEIAEAGDEGAQWLFVQMKKLDPDADGPGRSLAVFLQGRLPDVWVRYLDWKLQQ